MYQQKIIGFYSVGVGGGEEDFTKDLLFIFVSSRLSLFFSFLCWRPWSRSFFPFRFRLFRFIGPALFSMFFLCGFAIVTFPHPIFSVVCLPSLYFIPISEFEWIHLCPVYGLLYTVVLIFFLLLHVFHLSFPAPFQNPHDSGFASFKVVLLVPFWLRPSSSCAFSWWFGYRSGFLIVVPSLLSLPW